MEDYNIVTGLQDIHKKIKPITLDVDEHCQNPEEPSKLYKFIRGDSYLILRDDERKGIKIISLENGFNILNMNNIHERPISTIHVMNDNQTVVTGGNDKFIKVTNVQ